MNASQFPPFATFSLSRLFEPTIGLGYLPGRIDSALTYWVECSETGPRPGIEHTLEGAGIGDSLSMRKQFGGLAD